MAYFVYITASKRNGTIYTGVTNDLERRMAQHKFGGLKGFTEKYNIGLLVRFQEFSDINEAIMYEKKIKGWSRKKKLALIENQNPTWKDLHG